MSDDKIVKKIDEQIEEMARDEVPTLDIEMAIQRKYPEFESALLEHDGKPEKRAATEAKQPVVTDMQYEGGTATVTWQIPNFEISWVWFDINDTVWYVNNKRVDESEIDKLLPTIEKASRQLADRSYNLLLDFSPLFRADVRPPPVPGADNPRPTAWEHSQKNILQADKKTNKPGDPDWVARQRIDDAKKKLMELQYRHKLGIPQEKPLEPLKATPPRVRKPGVPFKPEPEPEKTKVPDKTDFDRADRLADATWWGANSSGDVGSWTGYDRIPNSISRILTNPANYKDSQRKGWHWDILEPYMFQKAYKIMYDAWLAGQARYHVNESEQAKKKP